MKVLIVEDDVRLAAALEQILEHAGYEADAVNDGQEGLDWALLGSYDVIVLDVMLPSRTGFSVVQELRRAGVSTPVLLLTARSAVADKIEGLDSGADDYMTKPFSPQELLARLRALGRRQGAVVYETLRVGDLSLDLESFELCRVRADEDPAERNGAGRRVSGVSDASDGEPLQLSRREFQLMQMLMSNPGQTISKELLVDRIWENEAESNSVEVYVSFLRKKLDFLESSVRIETVRGVGYRLVAE